jgi:tartrate dehydratase beta subunit/fumarate hydratase class I family protein
VITWLGFVTAVPRGLIHVYGLSQRSTASQQRLARLAAAERDLPAGLRGRNVVIIGPAVPVVSDAWYFGVRVVAQIPPASAERVRSWTPEKQRELLAALGQGPGEVAWLSKADGSFQMAPIPRGAP